MPSSNAFGQAIGEPVPGWSERPPPPRTAIVGRTCRVVPLDPAAHAGELAAAFLADPDSRSWTYLSVERPATPEAFRAYLDGLARTTDPLGHAIIDAASGRAVGYASLLRIDARNGVIEVGNINYSGGLKGSSVATEALFLLMRRVFDELGYRRYEWKCDSLNEPSRKAAVRLGFKYEGLFRQAVVTKGRNRDTAWYAIIDSEWPALKRAYEAWLDPSNFDADGRQKRRLDDLRATLG